MNVEQTVEQLIKAKQKEKEVARRLAWIEESDDDDSYVDGTIVRFEKKVGGDAQTHVAIKKAKYWYLISDTGLAQRKCWPDFLLWLSEDNPEPTLYLQVDAVNTQSIEVPTVEVIEKA